MTNNEICESWVSGNRNWVVRRLLNLTHDELVAFMGTFMTHPKIELNEVYVLARLIKREAEKQFEELQQGLIKAAEFLRGQVFLDVAAIEFSSPLRHKPFPALERIKIMPREGEQGILVEHQVTHGTDQRPLA